MDLNSLIFERETVITDTPEVVDIPAPAEPAPEPAPEPAAPAAADPLADYGLEPADLQELAELAPFLRQIRDQAGQQPQDVPGGPPEFDPFDPQSVQQYNDWRDQQMLTAIQQMVAPLVGQQQQQQLTEAENRAADILKDDQAQHGEFVGGDTVLQAARAYAETLLPQFQQRYGAGPRAAEAALTASAAHFRQLEDQIGTAAVDRYKNEMSTLAGAPKDLPAGTQGTTVPGEYATEMDVLAAFQARNAA